MSLGDRINAMADRLDREAGRAGLDDGAVEKLRQVFTQVAETRAARIGNREHHSVLHTARTALILLEDAGITSADLLIAAVALDTRDPHFMPDASALPLTDDEQNLITGVRTAVSSEYPIEELLAADHPVRLLAVSECLDHARHLHLRPEVEWQPFHETVCSDFLPVAQRTHATLAQRLGWWCDMFRNRYLRT